MSDSDTDSSVAEEVKDGEHAEEQQSIVASEEDSTAGMGLQILAGSIADFDPEGDEARPFDIVAVHGYNGDRHTSWGGPYSNWLQDTLFVKYPSSRILTFGYDTHGLKGITTRAGIRQRALQLLDELKLRRPTEPDHFRPLIFISQDIGGIIVKEALCIAAFEYQKYRTIVQWARLFIFFGCPHRSESVQDMEDAVANLVYSSQSPRQSGTLNVVKEITRSIIEINSSFLQSKVPTFGSIFNYYSAEEEPALQVFDRHTASYGTTLGGGCSSKPGPLKDICSTAPEVDEEYVDVYDTITKVLAAYPKPSEYVKEQERALRASQLQTAAAYPIEIRYNTEDVHSWLLEDETYKSWIEKRGSTMLHVYGADSVEAGKHILVPLGMHRPGGEPLAYFEFDKYDDKRNSLLGMLNSIHAQIFSHNPDLHYAAIVPEQQMAFYRSWTEVELWSIFRGFCTNLSRTGCYVLINGLHECDDSILWFLEKLSYLASVTEYNFKILLVSATKADIQSSLAKWPSINLDAHVPATNVESPTVAVIEQDTLQLIRQLPALFDSQNIVKEKLLKCGEDKQWRRIVLREFQLVAMRSEKGFVHKEVERIEITSPGQTLQDIMSRIPSEKQSWARKLLSFVLYAYHPLSAWELAHALLPDLYDPSGDATSPDQVYQIFTSILDDLFGGALIIEHNLVRFGHPVAREFFALTDQRPDAVQEAHREILDTLYSYISSKQGQATMQALSSSDSAGDLPVFTHRYSITTYAVKYWPRHFQAFWGHQKAKNSPVSTTEDPKWPFGSEIWHLWSEAHWHLSNPICRSDRAFMSLLPVFAGLGFDDMVNSLLVHEAGKIGFDKDCGFALVEAIRNGHGAIVEALLKLDNHTEAALLDALFAATSSTDVVILDKLVTYTAKNFPKFDWPATTVWRACQFGHVGVLRKLLEFGASPDTAVDLHQMTPLAAASREGHIEVVKLLLEHKVSVSTNAMYGRTPLHAACVFGHVEVAKLLISAGAELDALDDDEDTPIVLAVQWGNYKVLEVMVKQPCTMDQFLGDKRIRTPLTIAADQSFTNCARVLLENNANTEVLCKSDLTALRYAITRGNMELVNLLLDKGADTNTAPGGPPIITYQAADGKLDIIKLLVEHGATVDAVNSNGATALHCAAEKNYTECVEYLLEHGAAINAQMTTGHTSMMLAASAGHVETVKLLLDKGADISIPTTDGWNPIGYSYDTAEVTRILMEAGADADRTTNSYTPLYLASMYGYLSTVEVLLSYPVNTEIEYVSDVSQNGFTALSIAVTNEHKEIVRALLEAGADVNHLSEKNNFCLQYAVRTDDPSMLRTLMEYQPKLDLQDNDGDTAVSYIREACPLEMYQILVNAGASLDIPNKEGQTALGAAVLQGRADVVKYFISKKADLNPVGGQRGGPLHIACRWRHFEIVEMLVQAGADVNLVSETTAGTPLQSAARCWYGSSNRELQEKMVRYLLEEGKADVNVAGGLQGCALNAACGWASLDVVMLLLKNGAKTDIVDEMGRGVIHFASLQSLDILQQIVTAGVEIDTKDFIGRTAMHWAVTSGSLEIVERVMSLSRRLLDKADNDGWTPLLWAARGCDTQHNKATTSVQEQIISFLLDHGADLLVKGKGIDREMTPIQVARYHNVDDEIIQLLIKKTKEKLGKEELYIESDHAIPKATEQEGYCDSCYCQMLGNRYKCHDCLDFDLCYKCYKSRLLIHNKDHTFDILGPEFDVVVEVEKESTQEEDDTDDDTDEDTDDDDDGDEKSKD